MKKTMKPYSQVMLFSEKYEKKVESWFSGSFIDLADLRLAFRKNQPLYEVNDVLRLFGERHSVATVVSNPNESSITLCLLSGKFSRVVYVAGARGYESLASYCSYVKNFFHFNSFLTQKSPLSTMNESSDIFSIADTRFNEDLRNTYKLLDQESASHKAQLKNILTHKFE